MIDHKYRIEVPNALFSIIIPTWNNLPYLKLCYRSIVKNSTFPHQVIIHVNEGTDGTLEWVKEMNLSYTFSKQNIGICWALNAARSLVDTSYIVYVNDDMYMCPGWDSALDDEIKQLPDNMFFLSSTLLQPRPFCYKEVISPAPFGETVESFDEEGLLREYMSFPHGDWKGATWPPNVVHRDTWDLVGGYSVEFSPGMYSDPDFTAKLVLGGVKHFKGIDRSRVYHFEARSTKRVVKNHGSKQFLMKWGIPASGFIHYIIRRGRPFHEEGGKPTFQLKKSLLRGKLKSLFWILTRSGSTRKIWD